MAVIQLESLSLPGPAVLVSLAACAFFTYRIFYNLYFHPLAHVKGPWFARISPLYQYWVCFQGKEPSWTERCHRQYNAKVLRVAPNAISISDGSALQTIYIDGGGYQKDDRYQNFDIEGHPTIFSAQDGSYRDRRAKAVLPMISMARIRAASTGDGLIRKFTDEWISLLGQEKERAVETKSTVDILDMAQKLTCDIVTGYIFGKPYGSLEEAASSANSVHEDKSKEKLSLAPFIYSIVDFGKFSLLPNWLFIRFFALQQQIGRIWANKAMTHAFVSVHNYAWDLVKGLASTDKETYQGRLNSIGMSESELAAQIKAVTFAGTDSTAAKLTTLMFHLVQNPDIREKLREEFKANPEDVDVQTLPYLRAVVKEGLRLGMANPSRFTRLVPKEGLTVDGVFLPAGTIVGAAPYTLHHDAEIYPDPYAFRPERWLDESDETQRKERERNLIPFSLGMRACLARNLALQVLHIAVQSLIQNDILEDAHTCQPTIELDEYFNVGITGHHLDIKYAA